MGWRSRKACLLIVYIDIARDHHNRNMAEAFAAVTSQKCHVYHLKDTRLRKFSYKFSVWHVTKWIERNTTVYEVINGWCYPISAEVDFRVYKNRDPNVPHPHWITLKPVSNQIHFHLPSSEMIYGTTCSQLPLFLPLHPPATMPKVSHSMSAASILLVVQQFKVHM
jgi:hypothetical protein